MFTRSACGVLLAGLILLPVTTPAADGIPGLVQQMADRLGAAPVLHPGTMAYILNRDVDFPCAVTLRESRHTEDAIWLREYRFDLTDMETGVMLRARDDRRAITYTAEKTTANGEQHKYPPKLIYFIGLQVTDPGGKIQTLYDEAVTECREKNTL